MFKNVEYESIIAIKLFRTRVNLELILVWWFEDTPKFYSAVDPSSQTPVIPCNRSIGVCPESSLTSYLDILWKNKGHFACHFSKKYQAERGKIFTDLKLCRSKLWKILKEMGIPVHLTCLLRNLYAGQEATVGTGHGTTDWFQIGKGIHQGCILSPCLFNLYAEYIMRNVGLNEVQAGIKISGRNINNLRYADDTTLMAESEEEVKAS